MIVTVMKINLSYGGKTFNQQNIVRNVRKKNISKIFVFQKGKLRGLAHKLYETNKQMEHTSIVPSTFYNILDIIATQFSKN